MEASEIPANPSFPPLRSVNHGLSTSELLLRSVVLLLTVGACLMLVTDRQTVIVDFFNANLVKKADFGAADGSKSLVYTTAICAAYTLFHFISVLFNRNQSKAIAGATRQGSWKAWTIFLTDQALTYALLATAAAATEIAIIAKRGNEKLGWNATCGVFDRFCTLVGVALLFAFLGVAAFAGVSAISCKRLFS